MPLAGRPTGARGGGPGAGRTGRAGRAEQPRAAPREADRGSGDRPARPTGPGTEPPARLARRRPGPPTPQRGPTGERRARADGGDGPPTGQAARSPRLRGRRDPRRPQHGPPAAPPPARPGPAGRERSPDTRPTGRGQPTQAPQPGDRGAGVAGRGPHTFDVPPSPARRHGWTGAPWATPPRLGGGQGELPRDSEISQGGDHLRGPAGAGGHATQDFPATYG